MRQVNRTEFCAEDEVQVFHLINRCVRRTFHCGKNAEVGKDDSHRSQWIRKQLEELPSDRQTRMSAPPDRQLLTDSF